MKTLRDIWLHILCRLLHRGEHDYVEETNVIARVQVLRCRCCKHRSVGWG